MLLKLFRKQNGNITVGDCYGLKIYENLFVYFQYICKDDTQLGSDCVRFFNDTSEELVSKDDFESIHNSRTWFYSHTIIDGMGKFYKKIGTKPILEKEVKDLTFHSVNEFPSDDNPDTLETVYRIRKIGQKPENARVTKAVYELHKKYAWLDGVFGPYAYIERIPMKIHNPDYEHLY